VDPEKLKKYIESNPDTNLKNLGILFGVSACAIHNRLKAMGFSYKKKAFTYVEANEGKRNRYQEIIKNIPAEKLVYIGESGIELTTCKDKCWSAKGSPSHAKKSSKY
jgi:hypothetical protein